jgi:hypothetical protein
LHWGTKAILARFVRRDGRVPPRIGPERRGCGGDMRHKIDLATFRILLALAAIGSSALVLEAGRRWQ